MSQLPPPPPGPPASIPPPPPASAAPAPIRPVAAAGGRVGIGAQLIAAGWSIGVGVAGILLPIVSALILGGNVYYFYILPVFGLVSGVRAVSRGYVIGGGIGIALNVLAGLASLTAAGLFSQGG